MIEPFLAYLTKEASRWARTQRAFYHATGAGIATADIAILSPWFASDTLESVRIAKVDVIANPDFYSDLAQRGIHIPLDLTVMAGITYHDAILISESRRDPSVSWQALLFHECVHVVQYRQLGIDRFMSDYVTGWAVNGFQYMDIPMERDAYRLQALFEVGAPAMSVEDDVAAALRARGL